MRVERQKLSWLGAICAGLVLALAGCKQAPELPSVLSPYKIDIQQGNVITQEMLSKLKAGMTRSQVRFVLGSPLVVDPFRGDRWDYVSTYQKQGKDVERRRITVIFDDDKLIRIEGDVTLSDSALAPPAATEQPAAAAKPPANTAPPVEPAKPVPVAKPAAAAPLIAKPEAVKPPPVAAKPEPVKPSPAAPAAAKPEPLKPPPAAAVAAKPEAVRPAASSAEKTEQPAAELPKPVASKADTAKPESASETSAAEAAKAASAATEEKKAEAAKKDAPKEKPNPGFFGRMLDKLGI